MPPRRPAPTGPILQQPLSEGAGPLLAIGFALVLQVLLLVGVLMCALVLPQEPRHFRAPTFEDMLPLYGHLALLLLVLLGRVFLWLLSPAREKF